MTLTEELIAAALNAADDRKLTALKVLRGEEPQPAARPASEPLLMGMGAASRYLGVSRATLWRVLRAGTIQRVELFPGAYRVRRAELEALAAGKFGMSEHRSRRGRPRKQVKSEEAQG